MRPCLNLVSYKHRRAVAAALKAIYRAPDEAAAAAALDGVEADWGKALPRDHKMWRDAFERVIPLLAFPPEAIYMTKAIEFDELSAAEDLTQPRALSQRRWALQAGVARDPQHAEPRTQWNGGSRADIWHNRSTGSTSVPGKA